ncbi:MAG TPA: hypothetical protein ENH65_13445 [Candidatus Aminicenantes bacterium]|nr:hypothetical protein [Candidatus Aminicenantes bacterium]
MTEKLPHGEISRLAHHSGYSQQFISKCVSEKVQVKDRRKPYWNSPKFKKLLAFSGTKENLWRYGTPEEITAGIIAAGKKGN